MIPDLVLYQEMLDEENKHNNQTNEEILMILPVNEEAI